MTVARTSGLSTKNIALIASILGSGIVFLDATIVNVALPAIRSSLHGGLAEQQWVVEAYLLTLASLLLVGGSLGDLFGRRRVFAIGLVGFGCCSLLCAVAPSSGMLIGARAVQGIAGALLVPSTLALIIDTFGENERAGAIGTWTAFTGVATVIGPLGGGALVQAASWRWIFAINLVPVAITLWLLSRLPSDKRNPGHVDIVGAALCVFGLGGPVFALIEQPQRGWGDPLILGAFLGGAACLGAFVAYELRAPMPMLPLRLFRLRNFSVTNVETLSVYGGLSALTTFLTLYLIEFAGFSALQAGISLLPVTVVMFFLSPRTGRFSMQFGPRLFMALGPIVAGLGVLAYTRLPQDVNYWVDVLPALLVFSLGLSLTVAPLTTTVLADARAGDAGVASGVNNAVARIAGLLAIAILGILAAGGGDRLTEHGFHLTMAAVAVLLVCGGLIGAIGIRNPKT